MNHLIKFYKDKITTFVYKEEFNDFVETNIEELPEPFSDYYNHIVDFDINITVKDFIVQLNKHFIDIDKSFSAFNHGLSINLFYQETFNEPEKEYAKESDIIEIAWETDCVQESNVNYISEWVTFYGKINNFKRKHPFDVPTRAMQIIPLRNWKDLPLRLNKVILYREVDFQNNKSELKLKGIKQFILFELLSGFLYDLTYHGTPEQQISISNEIRAQIKNMNENMEENFPISFVPAEEFLKEEIKEKSSSTKSKTKKKKPTLEELNAELKKYVDNEEFEKAQKVKEKIKSFNKKG